ncbi:MAG: hypothetical protein R2695_02625 [Acidimicrobiales bacterium]
MPANSAPGGQDAGRPDEHGGVRIVAACVGPALDRALEVEVGVLGHGERVGVGPQQHGGAGARAVQVGPHRCDLAVALMDLEGEVGQRGEHLPHGDRVGDAELGFAVDGDGDRSRHRGPSQPPAAPGRSDRRGWSWASTYAAVRCGAWS